MLFQIIWNVGRPSNYAGRPVFDGQEQERRRHLGRLLREAREESGLTQSQVAKVLRYKQQGFISQIETGWKTLEPIELENFAHLYGKALNDFATWREDQPTTEELLGRAKRKS